MIGIESNLQKLIGIDKIDLNWLEDTKIDWIIKLKIFVFLTIICFQTFYVKFKFPKIYQKS